MLWVTNTEDGREETVQWSSIMAYIFEIWLSLCFCSLAADRWNALPSECSQARPPSKSVILTKHY